MSAFEEGLGPVMYVAGAREYERHFLSPLYRFLVLHPRNSVQRLPSYVIFILRYLSLQVKLSWHCNCAGQVIPAYWAPRVYAQASHERVGVGGWCPVLDSAGVPDTMLSRWFSLEITKEHFPWVFSKGDKPSRVIATLEALATLLALKLFYVDEPDSNIRTIQLQPTWTENHGNDSALNKLMSTRFPVNALLMPIVEWAPRLANRDADDLANGRTGAFAAYNEVKVDPGRLCWKILPKALQMGMEADTAYQKAKEKGVLPNRTLRQRGRRLEQRLRVADPW